MSTLNTKRAINASYKASNSKKALLLPKSDCAD